jgi:outer membrane protein assembly factor BamE
MVHSAPRSPAVPFIGALLLGCMLLLSGCVYRMAVQQGNYLDARQVVQVKEGMTRAQIRFLLGTPMLPDAFNRDRWDYLYTLNLGDGSDVTRQRLTVYFEDDKVSRIENAGAPTELPADASAAPTAPATPNPPATPGI